MMVWHAQNHQKVSHSIKFRFLNSFSQFFALQQRYHPYVMLWYAQHIHMECTGMPSIPFFNMAAYLFIIKYLF